MTITQNKFNAFIEKNTFLCALRRGFIMCLPLFIIGAMTLVLCYFPLSIYQSFITTVFNGQLYAFLLNVVNGTFKVISLVVTIAIAYNYATAKNLTRMECGFMSITSMVGYLTLVYVPENAANPFDVGNMFISVVVSFFCSHVYLQIIYLKKRKKFFSASSELSFYDALIAIVPILIVVVIFSLLKTLLIQMFNTNDIATIIVTPLTFLFQKIGATYFGGLLFLILVQIFWLLGMHGSNMMEPIAQKVFVLNATSEITIVSKTFIDTFAVIGGCGMSICLVLAILIATKNRNSKRITLISLVPAIFNINELLVFGLPLVLNPTFVIPFICVPLLSYSVCYFATTIGIMPIVTSAVISESYTWTTPAFFSGYHVTGSVNAIFVQLLCIILGTLIYLPFVKKYDKVCNRQIIDNITKLEQNLFASLENSTKINLLSLQGELGGAARMLANDIEKAVETNQFQMFYQGQYDFDGDCYGAEALLRWQHPLGVNIAPPLIVQIAKENNYVYQLEKHILSLVKRDVTQIIKTKNIFISVNVTALTLMNKDFEKDLIDIFGDNKDIISHINIEVTEESQLNNGDDLIGKMNRLREMGFTFSIDDFGMGHTSLLYLQSNCFNEVKLDGSLTRSLLEQNTNEKIISSIVFLGKSLHFNIVAEYVETKTQRDKLKKIGISHYQGYLYAKAIPLEEFLMQIQPNTQTLEE